VTPRGIGGDRDRPGVEASQERGDEVEAGGEEEEGSLAGRARPLEGGGDRPRPLVQPTPGQGLDLGAARVEEGEGLPPRTLRGPSA
jgi:hypothetical protein